MNRRRDLATIALLVFLMLGAVSVPGQERRVTLGDKRISISMVDKPLITVFTRLMYRYDIPIGFEESVLDQAHNFYEFEPNVPPEKDREQYAGRELFATRTISPEYTITVDFTDAPLKEVMNSIVKQMKNYDWEVRDGVVNIFPVKGRNPLFEKLLDIKVKTFVIGNGVRAGSVQPTIFDLPEFKSFLVDHKLCVDYGRVAPWFDEKPLTNAMSFSNMNLKQLLNEIANSKRGGWILQKNKHSTKKDCLDIVI